MSIQNRVLHVLSNSPGKPFNRGELGEATGLTELQAGNAATRLTELPECHVRRIARGLYVYQPPGVGVQHQAQPQPDEGVVVQPLKDLVDKVNALNLPAPQQQAGDRLFSEVRALRNGKVLIECEDGTLWVATPLDV